MTKKIGLIQTRGIGDIIMALPIADHFIEQGCEIVWPIDQRFMPIFEPIKPSIQFFPVMEKEGGPNYLVNEPVTITREQGCDRTIILYSYVSNQQVYDPRLSEVLKLDEYKYAIAGVPLSKKWTLNYERQMEKEVALFDSLDIKEDYVCIHDIGSNMPAPAEIPVHLTAGLRIVRVEDLTDSPLDWRLTLERAKRLIMVDSCLSNLVEQINLKTEKYLITRAPVQHPPVYKNGWQFIFPAMQNRA